MGTEVRVPAGFADDASQVTLTKYPRSLLFFEPWMS
jgi:hypothetical protein